MNPQEVRAPLLDALLAWLNTDRPLRFGQELAGQVVVLDFWTYCCINCIHILPDLAYLEQKYADQPVVFIGVHSAKFGNESDVEHIRAAIHRYEIAHPVVVDDQMAIWRSYGVRSWPTVVVVDPEGYIHATAAGEGNRDLLDRSIGELLASHRTKGSLAKEPLSFRRDGVVRSASGLAFPGKVLADAAGRRIFISDSNHNRILIASWPDEDGRCSMIETVGDGQVGLMDGPAKSARFNHPQGMALGREKLYVADTENHCIRVVNLRDWTVSTGVGTGQMSNDRAGGRKGTQQGLNSPWDLVIEGSTLYVAMAGSHQIWRIDMPVGFARALAGSGRENLVDGPTETSALAQPSGICALNGNLYFADSEVSALRGIDMSSEQVFTFIGEGLFHFGDQDGRFEDALLQHPLGVAAWNDDKLLVADTYNHKIKRVDLQARTIKTVYGDGQSGTSSADGGLRLFEPGGLSVANETLLVADTNNHRVLRVDLTSGRWAEIMIDGLIAPERRGDAPGAAVYVEPVEADLSGDLELILDVSLPSGAYLNAVAPWTVRVAIADRLLVQTTGRGAALPFVVKVPGRGPTAPWRVELSFAYCTNGSASLCVPAELGWEVSVRHSTGKPSSIRLASTIS